MLAEIYEALLVFERMNLDQLADSVHGNPRVKAKYDALEKKIESMQKTWAAERDALIAKVEPKTLTSKKAKVAR